MSLPTPERIRTLQRRLYAKAKKEPQYRFYTLYDKICRWDILEHAYHRARANAGAPGVDGMTFEQIEAAGVETFLREIQRALQEGMYRADPVRRVEIAKPDGKSTRPLGIPTIRTRVIQTAALLVLTPIFEADLPDNAWGYRPKRSALGAVEQVHADLQAGYTDVVDADLRQYFETIPHVEWEERLQARVCVYADDLVVLCRGTAEQALAVTRDLMRRIKLGLNDEKTRIVDARKEHFDFLGYTFGPKYNPKNGARYLGVVPSKARARRLRVAVHSYLNPRNQSPAGEVVGHLNRMLVGWQNYFTYGTVSKTYRQIDRYVADRLRRFLARRHKLRNRGTRQFPNLRLYQEYGLHQLGR
jgi:hypothetical protein